MHFKAIYRTTAQDSIIWLVYPCVTAWGILIEFDIELNKVTEQRSNILSSDSHSRKIYYFLQKLNREKHFYSEIRDRKWSVGTIAYHGNLT